MATTDRYEDAAKSYKNAMNKYSGEEGWNLAKKQGKEYQDQLSQQAKANAYKTSRSAGYGKALSGALGSQAGKDAAVTGMGQGTQAALANNQNTLSAAAQNYQNQADTAKNIYNQRMGITSGITGTLGSFLSAISDERAKEEIPQKKTWEEINAALQGK